MRFWPFCPSLLGQKLFVCFLGELKKPKCPFKINWPLTCSWYQKTKPPINQFTNLKCCIKAREPFKTAFSNVLFLIYYLTPNTPLIQLWCAWSKWNMDLKKYFHPKNDDEKWSRKNYFEIPPCAKPFLENVFYFIERGFLHQIANSVMKMTFFAHGGISIKLFVAYFLRYIYIS